MITDVLSDTAALRRAVELLGKGEIVALPTETVYGLAADALNAIAVAKIFEVKKRPQFNPLIIHLSRQDWLEIVTDVSTYNNELVLRLTQAFWPGPLTMVLPKQRLVPEIVTAGLDTVAVRISAHPMFAEVVQALGRPLAAPSANRFGRVSPTTAQHVLDELGGRIPMILDGGATQHGIESTIVALREWGIEILRRGPITAEQLSNFAKVETVISREKISAPGQLPSHYAPKTPLRMIDDAGSFGPQPNQRVALLAWKTSRSRDLSVADQNKRRAGARRSLKFVAVRQLSPKQDLREAAANLFRYLRELDALNLDLIVAERVPDQGLGAAILDRLERAAHRRTDEPNRLE
jgi:L-threonylcarbamoyladenylate synthase